MPDEQPTQPGRGKEFLWGMARFVVVVILWVGFIAVAIAGNIWAHPGNRYRFPLIDRSSVVIVFLWTLAVLLVFGRAWLRTDFERYHNPIFVAAILSLPLLAGPLGVYHDVSGVLVGAYILGLMLAGGPAFGLMSIIFFRVPSKPVRDWSMVGAISVVVIVLALLVPRSNYPHDDARMSVRDEWAREELNPPYDLVLEFFDQNENVRPVIDDFFGEDARMGLSDSPGWAVVWVGRGDRYTFRIRLSVHGEKASGYCYMYGFVSSGELILDHTPLCYERDHRWEIVFTPDGNLRNVYVKQTQYEFRAALHRLFVEHFDAGNYEQLLREVDVLVEEWDGFVDRGHVALIKARAHRRLNHVTVAARNYAFVARRWKHAFPEHAEIALLNAVALAPDDPKVRAVCSAFGSTPGALPRR